MQEEDWGTYSQTPWMTGGAWKDTNHSTGPKRNKAKEQPPSVLTLENNISTQTEEQRFRTEVELADLRLDLRRWNFSRSWRRNGGSSSLADPGGMVSPRTRPPPSLPPKDGKGPAKHIQGKAYAIAEGQAEKRHRPDNEAFPSSLQLNNAIGQSDPSLGKQLVGQYLDRCIAVAELQIAGARDKSRKKEAVREIERLVEKVIATQADQR